MLTKRAPLAWPRAAVAAPTNPHDPPVPAEDRALEPTVIALFADVDAILCAAAARLVRRRRPPAPPVTGCARPEPWSAGRSWQGSAAWWRVPAHPVRAVQRSPRPSEQTDVLRHEEVMPSPRYQASPPPESHIVGRVVNRDEHISGAPMPMSGNPFRWRARHTVCEPAVTWRTGKAASHRPRPAMRRG